MRLDLTVNIPTIMALLASVIAIASTGITLYYGLDKRQMSSEFEIVKLNQRVDKTEAAVSALKTDAVAQQTALRSEMKGDISEIKDMLNRIIFSNPQARQLPPQQTQQQLNDWRK